MNDEGVRVSAMSQESPLVSVVVLAYNHEKFIETAVISVLNQRTTFPIEILIGEDCSTDRTREILIGLDAKHPGRMKLLFRDANLGLSRNLQDCRERASGRYLAVLEGDDYWTDSFKLEKQCQLMEAHPDWSMSFHSCRIFHDDGSTKDRISPVDPPAETLNVLDLLSENRVPTMSVTMFRQGVIKSMPAWHTKLRNGDWALYVLHADRGLVGFLPDNMTAYRVHRGGLWSGWNSFDRWQQTLALFDYLEEYFEGRYAEEIEQTRQMHLAHLRQRVADLEKIERRYLGLRLDRVASVLKWLGDRWKNCCQG